MFDFLPLPRRKLRSGTFEWAVNENDSTLRCVKHGKKAGTAYRIDRVWRERQKIKRERKRIKKKKNLQSLPAGHSVARTF